MVGVAYLCDGTACRVTLSDEDTRFLEFFLFVLWSLVVIVVAAVAKLAVVDVSLLDTLAGLFLDAGNFLPLLLRCLDLILVSLCRQDSSPASPTYRSSQVWSWSVLRN